MGKVGVAEIMVEREGGEREMIIKKKREKLKERPFFFSTFASNFFLLGAWNPPLFIGVEERHVVF
jgi:hypothetical protein